jgi:DNA-binding response OmpR family regulator
MKVVIIEDEKSIIDAVAVAFEFRWPEAELAAATLGKAGVKLVKQEHPDIVILDVNLPDINGFQVLKMIREFSSVPVIILTVRADDTDVLRGLEAGADDYIIKPFNYLTLLARVKAVLRRTEAAPIKASRDTKISSRLKIDFVNQRVVADGRVAELTPVEYKMLLLLVKNKGETVSFERISQEIWGKDFQGDTDNIRIYIRRLRRKLGDNPPDMIVNQYGSGYIFKG